MKMATMMMEVLRPADLLKIEPTSKRILMDILWSDPMTMEEEASPFYELLKYFKISKN